MSDSPADVAAWLRSAAELDESATPGPWALTAPTTVGGEPREVMISAFPRGGWTYGVCRVPAGPDAEWTADARTRLPAAPAALRSVLFLIDGADLQDGQDGTPPGLARVTTGEVRHAITTALGLAAGVSRG